MAVIPSAVGDYSAEEAARIRAGLKARPKDTTYYGPDVIASSGAPVSDDLSDITGTTTGFTRNAFTPRFGGGAGFGGGIGGGGSLTGANPRDYNPASGGVPGVTSPISTVKGSLGDLTAIQGGLTGSALDALRKQYPGDYFNVLGTLLGNVGRRAAGDISDLLPELQQTAAERAVGGGFSGSAMENSKLLRDIGLTRYDVENQALAGLGAIQGLIPKVNPTDVTGIINQQLGAQERADMYRAAPNPEAAYNRAKAAAGGGGGGGGGGTPGIRYGGGGASAGSSVDDILKRYGAGMGFGAGSGPPIVGRGTAGSPMGQNAGLNPAPFGSIPYNGGGWSPDDYGIPWNSSAPTLGPEDYGIPWDSSSSVDPNDYGIPWDDDFDPLWDTDPTGYGSDSYYE